LKFVEADLTQTDIAPETFASEDLTSRVRFFASLLYKHFVECRAVALLSAAQQATCPTKRSEFLQLLYSSASPLDGEVGIELKRKASWALSMFGFQTRLAWTLSWAARRQRLRLVLTAWHCAWI
jgi:hypothetical protein